MVSAKRCTEAGCNVVLNERMKQSGMRWNRSNVRKIVDLRTACHSKLWNRIWSRSFDDDITRPETNSRIQENVTQNLTKTV